LYISLIRIPGGFARTLQGACTARMKAGSDAGLTNLLSSQSRNSQRRPTGGVFRITSGDCSLLREILIGAYCINLRFHYNPELISYYTFSVLAICI